MQQQWQAAPCRKSSGSRGVRFEQTGSDEQRAALGSAFRSEPSSNSGWLSLTRPPRVPSLSDAVVRISRPAAGGSVVRARWLQWSEVEPVLGLVDDLAMLPKLMRRLEPSQRDDVLAAQVRLSAVETEATVALVWLLVPGASRLAGRISDLSVDIDELVAGQLWIQSRQHDPEDARYVAAKILKCTEREVKAELGVGDLARRRDKPG